VFSLEESAGGGGGGGGVGKRRDLGPLSGRFLDGGDLIVVSRG